MDRGNLFEVQYKGQLLYLILLSPLYAPKFMYLCSRQSPTNNPGQSS